MTLIAILANGDYPTHIIPLQALNEAEVIVCCDSAVATMMEQGYSPRPSQRVQVVGDGDSLTPELRKLVPYPIFNESEQDYNDLSKAFRWIMNNIEGLVDISIIGATGKREDHTIGNISLLMDYHERLQQERKGSSVRIVSDYGTFHAFTFELGLQSHVTDKLTLGAYIFNPISFSFKQTLNHEKLPIVFRFGMAYKFTKDFNGQCEIEKNTERTGVSLRGGLEYEAFKNFYIRAGVQTNPGILSFGVGYGIRFAQINVAAQLHNELGASLQVGMIFSIGK